MIRVTLTPEREKVAKQYARTIFKDYGRHHARNRVHEITAGGIEQLSPENQAFYGRIREIVEKALAGGEDP